MLEPGKSDAAVGRLVGGQLAHHFRLGTGVGEYVDEVYHQHIQWRLRQLVHLRQQAVGGDRVVEFVVGESFLAPEARQLLAQQCLFMQVLALFFLLVHPKRGVHLFDLQGHQSREDGVAGVLRGGRQNAEVDIFVYVEVICQFLAQHAPLVKAEVIEHQQKHLFARGEQGEDAAFHHVGAEYGAAVGRGNPCGVVLCDELGEISVGIGFLHLQHLVHRAVGLRKFQLPVHQLFIEFFPALRIKVFRHLEVYFGKLLPVTRLRGFLHDFAAVYVFLNAQQDLVGVDGLDEVVGDFRADGLVHNIFLLVFRYHHHGRVHPALFELRERFEAAEAGHVFIEKYEVEIFFLAQFERVRAVGSGGNVITFLFEKQDVGAEQVNLVVHPKQSAVCHCDIFYIQRRSYGKKARHAFS